ncbi:MAG: hypothetical protein WC435_01840 [Candidatus Paceibacterota bacterium]
MEKIVKLKIFYSCLSAIDVMIALTPAIAGSLEPVFWGFAVLSGLLSINIPKD